MSKELELNLEQIKLSLSDYQSELNAIDAETDREKERILEAIQAEEAEIKSLLDRYREIKRQKELQEIKSSYNTLTNFKKALLSKIELEAETTNNLKLIEESEAQLTISANSLSEGGDSKKYQQQINGERVINEKVKVIELIQFIEGITPQDLVAYYPADIAIYVPSFDVSNTVVRDELLKYYQKDNIAIYNALLKLYQKPNLDLNTIRIPEANTLSLKDRGYHGFLADNYPRSLPFFWYLIERESDTIRYVVMEFAVDHIIQTSTLENDLERQELNLTLTELLAMNEEASTQDFLRDIFISFHPRRVSQKSSSRNKYFDYVTNLIQTQATLEDSEVLQIWNHMLNLEYERVASPDFEILLASQNEPSEHNLDLVSSSQNKLA